MNWIVAKIKWILLASGVVTCSALYAAIAPDQALEFLFARSLENSPKPSAVSSIDFQPM